MEYHIQLDKKLIEGAKYAIIAGDPGRIEKIASFLDDPREITRSREYTSYLGYLHSQPVLVISHGIGGPSTAICVEELAHIGVKNFVRVGTSGGMQLKVRAGDVVIVSAAIRQEGTSREYLPIEFPAVADFNLTCALKQAADRLEISNHVGVVHCKDSFYGQHAPETMPVKTELTDKWRVWCECGALVSEMETAALFSVSIARGLRAGAVMLCIWNQERDKAGFEHEECFETQRAIMVAVTAVSDMILSEQKLQ